MSESSNQSSEADASELPVSPDPINRALVAHRIVQLGILITLMWKWTFFTQADRVYREIILHDTFFPELLRSVSVLRTAFLAAVISCGFSLVTGSRWLQRVCAFVCLLGCSVLCIHQGSYNDMTFVTAWWASVWTIWYAWRIDDDDQLLMLNRAALLSRLIISVILLGGAIGKWTGEYWSGEVFFDIYFLDRDFWLFNWLRDRFDQETLQVIAKWYSRKVILTETVAGFGLWALPPKWAAIIAIVILNGIALLSNFYLYSVLASLIGLATVGLFVPKTVTKSR